ncbi:Uncharacterised protein [uncultured archaeon]|nr:Uncharacterised protein [uncultured archaeon]
MSKIYKHRDSIIKRDKKDFINGIHDFSEEDIIGLTEQEFEEIQKCCMRMNLTGVDEFFDFLLTEGIDALNKSEIEYSKENLLISRFYLTIFLKFHCIYDKDYARTACYLGDVNRELADLGVEPEINLKQSIELYQEIRRMFQGKNPEYIAATTNLGINYVILADFGIEPEQNLKESIKLQEEARHLSLEDSSKYLVVTLNLGLTHLTLAQLGIEPEINLIKTINLCQEIRKATSETSMDYTKATLNYGFALILLADLGIETEKNLEVAIKLQIEARKNLPKKSLDFGRTLMNEGRAYFGLAELGINTKKNLEEAIKLLREARKNLPKMCLDYAGSSICLGYALIGESIHQGVNSEKNINEAIETLKDAQKILPKTSLDTGSAFINLGVAHRILAILGIEPEKNLEECIKLQQKAIEILPMDRLNYAKAILNKASAYEELANNDVKSEKNFQLAEELYKEGINIFLEAKDGWNYPVAVLSIYNLYRNIFWRSGDKSILEKSNNALREAKKNIEGWEVLRKNIILGELYSVEADFHELEEDYYKAGLKYRDAYKLTKKEYYRFMCDFCGAKVESSKKEEKHFCRLVDRWKEIDKKGIFLDFYDYAIFECYLEEALENEALRFDEVTKAISKLDEIYVRTSIYHIKIRVSACIEILNAYLNYFPKRDNQKNEEKAKENISSACRIFQNQGYKHEIDLCNQFIKAIKNKERQEVWLDLIKNQLSNNFSKLIREAAFDEITKLHTRGIKADLGEIKTGIKEIKINIDNLTISLKSGISEELVISVGAEFAGTGAKHEIHIPLQKITYPEIKKDLENIKSENIIKLTSLPAKLATKIREYLVENEKDELLKYSN